jgi:hypothetical protein
LEEDFLACFVDGVGLDGDFIEDWVMDEALAPRAICAYLDPEQCEVAIACVEAQGGVAELEAIGYPAPGTTSSCPPPPGDHGGEDGGDTDAGG